MKVFISALIVILVTTCEIGLFAYVDQCNYLQGGVSIRNYDILPYNTRLWHDRNISGFHYFSPTKIGGFSLEPIAIFDGLKLLTQTIISSEAETGKDTICIAEILEYGYNNEELLVSVRTLGDETVWLYPTQRNNEIEIRQMPTNEIDKSLYHWINPHIGASRNMCVWIALLIAIPISVVLSIFFIVYALVKNGIICE